MSLLAFWSPKGGSGTSVVAAACALQAVQSSGVARLVDLCGDQPAILGLGADPETGVADWLAMGPAAPTDALDRLGVEIVPGLSLLPHGRTPGVLEPVAAAEAGAALAVALRDGPTSFVDVGVPTSAVARAVVEVADASVIVMRECYVALRRAVRNPSTARAFGVVVVQEPGRSLGPTDLAQVLTRPVIARIPTRDAICRAVDAGTLPARLPEPLARGAASVLRELGLGGKRRGVAA
jgi:MinD-like ATPase involved in chromosome partitioning or flagellar assembly